MKTKKKTILIVFGTRPEAIKMAPVLFALKCNPSLNVITCVTGQHREMLDQVLKLFQIKPEFDLNVMVSNQRLADLSSVILRGVDEVIRSVEPDLVLVHGDTTTSIMASLAAFYNKVKIGHVEAGLRTGDLQSPWPEEANRTLTARLADYHFAPTLVSKNNLIHEGISPDSIFITGNTVVDALHWVRDNKLSGNQIDETMQKQFDFLNNNLPNILITCHRRENFGSSLNNICNAISSLAESYKNFNFIFPVHLNPNIKLIVEDRLKNYLNVHLLPPLSYLPFVYLMNKSHFVLTDSGGIQEEAPALGKPVLLMRDNTERPEAVDAGTVKLVGSQKNKIIEAACELIETKEVHSTMANAISPYGNGTAASQISKIIEDGLLK